MRSDEEVVREAYRLAEGDTLDAHGFRALFTEDGTFNDVPNSMTFRGDQIPQALAGFPAVFPDVHRELLEVRAIGEIRPTGNRIDVPTADLWYLRDGKIESFNCYNAANVLLAQIGATPDFRSAIEAAKGAPDPGRRGTAA